MSRIIIFQVAVFLLLIVASAFANPDGVVVSGGDLKISDLGTGLVFPNGTTQYSANSIATENVSAPGSVSFPNGVASPAQTTCVQCPQGMVAVGGGGMQTAGGVGFVLLNGSYPSPDTLSWCVVWVGSLQSTQTSNVQTWATCLKPTP